MEAIKFVTRNKNDFNPTINSLLYPGLESWSGWEEPELKDGPEDLVLLSILSFTPRTFKK